MKDDDPIDSPSAAAMLIWARRERSSARGPAPSTSRVDIAAAAVAIADQAGMRAVTMRKVAAAVEIASTSLYGYVRSKDELIDLMVDWVEGEEGQPPAPSGDWRADLAAMASKIRRSILRHPWMATITAGRPSLGPNSLAWAEFSLAGTGEVEADIDAMIVASNVVDAYARGFTARQLADQQALKHIGMTYSERGDLIFPYLRSVVHEGNYPHLGRVLADADVAHLEGGAEELFVRGLHRVLNRLL